LTDHVKVLFWFFNEKNQNIKSKINFLFKHVDINECETLRPNCGGGKCVNLAGNYSCSCYTGYKLNEKKLICEGSLNW
jgi:hypothetical protein